MPVMRLVLLLCALLLTGCGTYYNVSVDSLRDMQQPSGTVYVMQPGNQGVSESDLLFREVVRQITPAFRARGYTVVDDMKRADNVAVVSYWMDEPRVYVGTDTITRSYPVVVGRGKYRHVSVYLHNCNPFLIQHGITSYDILRPVIIEEVLSGLPGTADICSVEDDVRVITYVKIEYEIRDIVVYQPEVIGAYVEAPESGMCRKAFRPVAQAPLSLGIALAPDSERSHAQDIQRFEREGRE